MFPTNSLFAIEWCEFWLYCGEALRVRFGSLRFALQVEGMKGVWRMEHKENCLTFSRLIQVAARLARRQLRPQIPLSRRADRPTPATAPACRAGILRTFLSVLAPAPPGDPGKVRPVP